MDNSVDCVHRAVLMYCDQDAADHMTEMMIAGFQPIKDYLDCPGKRYTRCMSSFHTTVPRQKTVQTKNISFETCNNIPTLGRLGYYIIKYASKYMNAHQLLP